MSFAKSPDMSKNSASSLLNLYEPPPPPTTADDENERNSTSLSSLFAAPAATPRMQHNRSTITNTTTTNNNNNNDDAVRREQQQQQQQPAATEKTRLLFSSGTNGDYPTATNNTGGDTMTTSSLLLLSPRPAAAAAQYTKTHHSFLEGWKQFLREALQPSTFAGACIFLFYHIVFCLANASAIVRPHHLDQPVLGEMAKWTTVGICFAGPFYIYRLGQDIPAVYPSNDLFLAPFLASAAAVIDNELALDDRIDDNNSQSIFFASFAVLAAIGMLMTGGALLMASVFKLANLGSFLPYSVLCGFFSAVGVLLWALAFSVDTSGKRWQQVFFSGDGDLIWDSLLHHIPSLVMGVLMKVLGPRHPFYVLLLILLTLIGFYMTMYITGTSLEEAQAQKWFWSREDLVIDHAESQGGFLSFWQPPVPFGQFGALFQGLVHWRGVRKGLGDMFSLAFLYLLRSSIHTSAVKKNVSNLVRKERVPKSGNMINNNNTTNAANGTEDDHLDHSTRSYAKQAISRISSNVQLVNASLEGLENVSANGASIRLTKPRSKSMDYKASDLDAIMNNNKQQQSSTEDLEYEVVEIRPDLPRRSLQEIFLEYGYALVVVGLAGGFGICPTVSTSNTLYAIGAGHSAPQYGSILLLLVFYATDFSLVRYIPKACFSSLLVLGAVDTFNVWFFVSFRKTQDLLEWLVNPFIVAFSLVVGFLNAIFLGVGLSIFVFVNNFFRVGVVKYNATGLELRSTIERSAALCDWLDSHGDYIRVLVLQNYLFFGNASAVLSYIGTMFEPVSDPGEPEDPDSFVPPIPKVLILDMSLITGLDTSTMDIFGEIKTLCTNNDCKLFLCGLSTRAKIGLGLAGVKPEAGLRNKRTLRFFLDLDTALGKAEDIISRDLYKNDKEEEPKRNLLNSFEPTGFRTTLKLIDEQLGQEFSSDLADLEPYTTLIELKAGDHIYESNGGQVADSDSGLLFIESGWLKIERDASETLTRGRSTLTRGRGGQGTLNNLHARRRTLGSHLASLKANNREATTQVFRLARVGPGWVCGALEMASGLRNSGVHVADTNCRLHHLPLHRLEEVEERNPKLVLQLYKMLSHFTAHRQEVTIEQLATLHTIMSAPAHSKPLSRKAAMAFRR